jgi:hypothetical protein
MKHPILVSIKPAAAHGSWQLSVTNPNFTSSPATFPTRPIDASIGAPAFITGIAISGTSATTTTPTISWTAPAFTPPAGYTQSTRVFVVDLDNNRQTIARIDVASNVTSLDIPASANLSPTVTMAL